jgi:hypothetical protein
MDDDVQEQVYLIPKEEVIEQRTISFFGDDMIAALTVVGSTSHCQACAKRCHSKRNRS